MSHQKSKAKGHQNSPKASPPKETTAAPEIEATGGVDTVSGDGSGKAALPSDGGMVDDSAKAALPSMKADDMEAGAYTASIGRMYCSESKQMFEVGTGTKVTDDQLKENGWLRLQIEHNLIKPLES